MGGSVGRWVGGQGILEVAVCGENQGFWSIGGTGTLGGRGEYFRAAVAVGGLKGIGRKDGAEKVGGMGGGFF